LLSDGWEDSACDEDRDGEHTPLIAGRDKSANGSICAQCCTLTILYFWVSAINGSLIGALGPSLAMISRNTGLNDGALGRYVLQNRLCKFAGTLIWCAYSHQLQRRGTPGRPHALFSVLMLVSGLSAVVIGTATDPFMLQLGLLSWGIAYGVTDSGITSLTVWRWEHESRRRRFDLALINAGFTVGALLAPTMLAASLKFAALHLPSSRQHNVGQVVFELISAGCVLLSAALAMQESVSVPSSADADAAAAKDEDGGALPTLTSWQGHGRGSRGRRLYVGMFIGAMSLCLACNTGAEHSMATWLPALGTEVGGLSAQRMAVIAST